MPKMRGFLRSKPKIDAAEWAITETRTAARLGDLFPSDGAASGKDASVLAAPEGDEAARDASSNAVGPAEWLGGPRPPIIVVGVSEIVSVLGQKPADEPTSDTSDLVAVMVEPEVSPANAIGIARDLDAVLPEPGPVGPVGVVAGDAAAGVVAHDVSPAKPIGVMAGPDEAVGDDAWQLPRMAASEPDSGSSLAARLFGARPVRHPDEAPEPRTGEPASRRSSIADRPPGPSATTSHPERRRPPAARSAVRRAATASPPARRSTRTRARSTPVPVPVAPPVVVVAHCPYCAKLLEPAPTASRRCDRCRQRIIVKRTGGVVVYLTEAAVSVFEAERRRVVHAARWSRDRDRWLGFASAAGASASSQARLAAARVTEDVVAAARTLYMTTVDRAVRTALRDNDWDEAVRLRRDEAALLYRVAGSPVPPPEDVVAVFLEGVTAELRRIAAISGDAELVSARCCAACLRDDHLVVRISQELQAPRLPHAGCPKGLCRCHWALAARDRQAMRRFLRRRPGVGKREMPAHGDPAGPSLPASAGD